MSCEKCPTKTFCVRSAERAGKRTSARSQAKELHYWLGFDQLTGVGLGAKRTRMLFEHFLSAEAAWNSTAAELKTLPWLKPEQIKQFIEKRAEVDFEKLLATLEKEARHGTAFLSSALSIPA